jgi:hypothetical protein
LYDAAKRLSADARQDGGTVVSEVWNLELNTPLCFINTQPVISSYNVNGTRQT